MKRLFIICLIIISSSVRSLSEEYCLFKNPLCFYSADILTYLKTLHKNQQYEKMSTFFYGPFRDKKTDHDFHKLLSSTGFGYAMKRVGIKSISKEGWSITYQRTIQGTNETFKVNCAIVRDTCRIYLDINTWNTIFNR